MRGLLVLFSILLSVQAFAEQVSCSVFTLGAGLNNYGVYGASVDLSKSPSGESLLGTLTYEFPEAVLLDNSKAAVGAENIYQVEISLKYQENTSKWLRGAASISGGVTLTKKGEFLAYQEFNSNTLFNTSDKRRVEAGKVIGVNTVLISPLAVQQVSEMNTEELNVLGVNITVKDLVREIGFQNGASHLADQGKISSTLLTGVQINCTN